MKSLCIISFVLIGSLFAAKILDPKNLEEVTGVVTDKFKANALAQSYAGRAFLTWPNKDANTELSNLCRLVAKLVTKLKAQLDDPKCQGGVYRSNTQNGATGGATADKLAEAIARVATTSATPNDRMVCITTMGDIAQAMVDSQVKSAPAQTAEQKDKDAWKCQQDSYPIIAAFLGFDAAKLSEKVKEFSTKRSANSMTKNKKKEERANGEFKKRSGIYYTGPDADKKLKEKGATSFINQIGWPVQKIEETRLKALAPSGEPWAGHITGSGPECYFMMDLLLEKKFPIWIDYPLYCPKANFKLENLNERCSVLNTPQRKARTAIVLGFLQGAGFHSSFENHLCTNQYTGFNYWPSILADSKKTDTGHTDYAIKGKATAEMNKILASFTSEPVQKKRQKRGSNLK